MYRFLILGCILFIINYGSCGSNSLTEKDVENGLTIVLPRQKKHLSLKCHLEIAKDGETKSDFHPMLDIKELKKERDGMEYVPNYYQIDHEDSCTFRIYPKILDKIPNIFQMRYWKITSYNYISEVQISENLRMPTEYEEEKSTFYMENWSWWKQQHVNTLTLEFNKLWTLFFSSDNKYSYVDREVKDAYTIIFPREDEYLILTCLLEMAVDTTTTKYFNHQTDITKATKNIHGMELIPNYYNTGKNDSCTFRIYPDIFDKFLVEHEMRYWKVTVWELKDEKQYKKIFLFHMKGWWSWKNYYHANSLELTEGILTDFAGLKYLYI